VSPTAVAAGLDATLRDAAEMVKSESLIPRVVPTSSRVVPNGASVFTNATHKLDPAGEAERGV
jgi:hypothetical protein